MKTKKNIIIVVFTFFSFNLFSQIEVKSTGKTGIGLSGSDEPHELLQIGDRLTFHNGGTKFFGYNCYYSGSDKRILAAGSSSIRMSSDGSVRFCSAPTGSANSTISWNYGISMLSNGYVGIGNTSPEYKLDIDGGNIRFCGHDKVFLIGKLSDIVFKDYNNNSEYGRIWTTSSALNIRSRTGYDITILRSNGYVGINDYSPSYMLDVNGDIAVKGVKVHSDKNLKKDIKDISHCLEKVRKLEGKSYKLLDKDFLNNDYNDSSFVTSENNKIDTVNSRDRFGFIAQDLQQIFPELVDQDNEGYLNIDYIALIPILVESIKELDKELNSLKNEKKDGSNLKSSTTDSESIISNDLGTNTARLYQNSPNPFNLNTEIKIYIPENATNSYLYIFDMNGTQIEKYKIQNNGDSSIIIYGSTLRPGMYLYTLITDGIEIDTKRMILTD